VEREKKCSFNLALNSSTTIGIFDRQLQAKKKPVVREACYQVDYVPCCEYLKVFRTREGRMYSAKAPALSKRQVDLFCSRISGGLATITAWALAL